MALFRSVNGVMVQLTPEEEAALLAEWQANAPPTAEQTRLAAFDGAIAGTSIGATQPATLVQLKAMTNAEFSSWFDTNFDTAAKCIALLKALVRILIRRVL